MLYASPVVSWLPNALTAARLVAVIPFAILLAEADDGVSAGAAVIFAAASFTDFLDGYLARRYARAVAVRPAGRPAGRPAADRRRAGAAGLARPAGVVAGGAGAAARRAAGDHLQAAPRGDHRAGQLHRQDRDRRDHGVADAAHADDRRLAGDPVRGRPGAGGRRGRAVPENARREGSNQGRRDGRRGGHPPSPADLEPAEADGADRGQAVHAAHRRAAAPPRVRRHRRHRGLPAAGDPRLLRRRRRAGRADAVLGRGVARWAPPAASARPRRCWTTPSW